MVLNGYTYFVSQLHLVQQLASGPTGAPLAVHMSRVAGGKEAKVHRMREATRCVALFVLLGLPLSMLLMGHEHWISTASLPR